MEFIYAPHPASGRAGRPLKTGLRPGSAGRGGADPPGAPLLREPNGDPEPRTPGAPGEQKGGIATRLTSLLTF